MVFDGVRQPDTIYAASVSRGKDSTAMLEAIKKLGWPLDVIYAVDIWATDDIPAELPPMVAFKDEWDAKCLERYGVPVTRICAMRGGQRLTYEKVFYSEVSPERVKNREELDRKKQIRSRNTGGGSQSQDSRLREHLGATASNQNLYRRLAVQERPLVQFCPQAERNKWRGFPIRRGPWCNSYLKASILDHPTFCPRARGEK